MKFSFGSNRGSATTRKDIRVEYAPGRRAVPWIRWCVVLLLVFSPLLFFLYRSLLPWFVVSSPASIAMKRFVVSIPKAGTILEVPFSAGTDVKKGDVLFRIEADDLEAKNERLALLRDRLSSLDTARAAAAEVEKGQGVSGLSGREVALAYRILRQAEKDRMAVVELLRRRAATKADLRLARQEENRARADLIRAQSDRLRELEEKRMLALQARRDQDALKRERRRLERDIEVLESQITSQDVLSPLDGRILDVGVSPGETLPQGAPLATMVNADSVSIVVFVDSEALSFIRKDAEVSVRFPGKFTLKARVDRFPSDTQTIPGEFATFAGARRTIRVFLRPMSPIPSEYLIEGLPLVVRWGVRLPGFLQRFVNETGEF